MKFSALCLALVVTSAAAFSPAPVRSKTSLTTNAKSSSSSSSSTRLFISSWGKSGPTELNSSQAPQSPVENIQAYIPSPTSVEARKNLGGSVLVSGWTDSTLFDMLNNEDSAFEFDKIVAFSADSAKAKKQLLSRSARYTGLLNKLDYTQAATETSAFPTVEQLQGVSSWVAVVDDMAQVQEIASLCQAAESVENVSILVVNAAEAPSSAYDAALEQLKVSNTQYSIIAVGALHEDHEEGKIPCKYSDFDAEALPSKSIFSTHEALRMVTECLQLEAAVDKAYAMTELTDEDATSTPDYKLIKGLREAGYNRPQEIDHMVRLGTAEYEKALENFKELNPGDGVTTTQAWWEDENFQKSVKESSLRKEELMDSNKEREERLTLEAEK